MYMKKIWPFKIAIAFVLILSACTTPGPVSTPTPFNTPTSTPTNVPTSTPSSASADNPCIGAPTPTKWNNIVVLMFENKNYNKVIEPTPYITSLAKKWPTSTIGKDENTKVVVPANGQY